MDPPNEIPEGQGDGSGSQYRACPIYIRQTPKDSLFHIMRICSPKFNVKNLIAPIKLVRDVQKPTAPNNNELGRSNSEEGQSKDVYNVSKVVPYCNSIKNRQNLFRKMTKTYQLSHTEASEAESRPKNKDADKYPWIFSDFESPCNYVGVPEGNQDSTYMLFKLVKKPDNTEIMEVIPIQKWYKFTPRSSYRTAQEEKSEDVSKPQKATSQSPNTQRRFKDQSDEQESMDKNEKSWKSKYLNVNKSTSTQKRTKDNVRDGESEELDYEEEFADDEEVNLGIEDAEDQREALGRQFKKYPKNSEFKEEFSDYDDLYLGESQPKRDRGFENTLKLKIDYNEDDSGDDNSIFSEDDENLSYISPETKKDLTAEEPDKKKQKIEDERILALNKKMKKPPYQQEGKKNGGSATPYANHTNPEVSSSNLNTNVYESNDSKSIPRIVEDDSSQICKPKPGSTQAGAERSDISCTGAKKPVNTPASQYRVRRRRPVTEADVIDFYKKRGVYVVKAKELASKLVLICENTAKSKEDLKALLNRMVRSEGGMLHLLPEYRK